jgi:TPR repeat protein
MMKFSLARLTALASLALSLHCPAMADELADANKLLANKEYPQALALYGKLADGGNVEAQFHLGEMHWYGEAGKIDLDQARLWFGKAAAAGNAGAKSALDVMRQRELRRADIAYWVSGYDGAELKSGKFNCARPFVPPISKSDAEVKRVEDGYLAWKKCYNGFVQNINDALPPGKRIPADVAKLMNQVEYDQAVAHLDEIYAALLRQASTGGAAINADYKDWHEATSELVEGIQGR